MDYKNILECKRINVVGTSSSGKTTFSKSLANILGIDHIEMDGIFWGPDWYWPSDEEFFTNLREALKKDAWVLDGNYTRSIHLKWKNIDLVIWLDYSFVRTFFQALIRAVKRSITKEELWAGTGNRESFTKSFFSKDSIILWTVKTHGKVKRKYRHYMKDEKYSGIRFLRLKSPSDSKSFLKHLKHYKHKGPEKGIPADYVF